MAAAPEDGPTRRPVVVEAVRTPIGKRDGSLSCRKPVELLGCVLDDVLRRAGVGPEAVDQVIGGCVTQIGEQGLNVTRNAWLDLGFPYQVPCTTVDLSCGSAQQANHMVAALIAAGAIDVGIACGVEAMSRVPAGANVPQGHEAYKTERYPWDDPPGLQFGGAERIAWREGHSRADLDEIGGLSHRRAAAAWDAGRFDREVVPVGPVRCDEGPRPSPAEELAALRPTVRGGLHTAATTSQVSDGAAALLWMAEPRARALGLTPRARLRHQVVVGTDPYYLLDGPVVATERILQLGGLSLSDLDLYEVNEAFASVVLSWVRHHGADVERLNVNGGAIALGHPMGATGARLLVSALHELERRDGQLALVAMCCGGAHGTASVLERL